jgi:ribosomal protein S18 acetylase RimI-like enzyme
MEARVATFEEVQAGLQSVNGPKYSSLNRRHCTWFAAFEGEQFLGCLVLDETMRPGVEGVVTAQYVEPGSRNTGVGQALVDAERKYAKEQGLKRVYYYVANNRVAPKKLPPLDDACRPVHKGRTHTLVVREVEAA